jgi:hypothetical protein
MPVQGFVRNRRHLFGRQGVYGSVVAATRAYPFTGTPDVELSWTDPEIDAGSRDPVAAPYRGAPELTASLEAPALAYNDLVLPHSAFFGGEIEPTGGGTAKTWTYAVNSTTVDEPDPYTYQFGDDVLTDWYQFGDCILEGFEISSPNGKGPLAMSMDWRMGSVASTGSTDSPVTGVVPTAGLAVATGDAYVYLKDGAIYIASTTAGLGAGQVSDALHEFTLRASHEIDLKYFANGTQSFAVDAYGPGARAIEFEATFAKTADTVGTGSESDAWMSDVAVDRYVRMIFTSTAEAQGGTPYSWQFTMPMRYYTRTEGEIGGNTTVVLTGHAFYDPVDFTGVFDSVIVNTLTELGLGS